MVAGRPEREGDSAGVLYDEASARHLSPKLEMSS